MPMKNPCHPGEIVMHECLEPLGLNITSGAEALGVSRVHLSKLVNGHTRVTPEMAVRLTKAFGSTVGMWLRLQAAWDEAQALKQASKIKVRRVRRPRALALDEAEVEPA